MAARSGADPHAGEINYPTMKYSLVMPKGTYQLAVCHVQTGSVGAEVRAVYLAPTAVQVSGDVARDVTLPTMELFSVTGTLQGTERIAGYLGRQQSLGSRGDFDFRRVDPAI